MHFGSRAGTAELVQALNGHTSQRLLLPGTAAGPNALGSQGPLVLGEDHRWLLAANADSDELSVFRVRASGSSWWNRCIQAVSSRPVSPSAGMWCMCSTRAVRAIYPGSSSVMTAISILFRARPADGRFLSNVNAGSGTVSMDRISASGSLTSLGEVAGLSADAGAVGMAVRREREQRPCMQPFGLARAGSTGSADCMTPLSVDGRTCKRDNFGGPDS